MLLKDNNYLIGEIKKNSTKSILKEIYPTNFKHEINPQIQDILKKSTQSKDRMLESIKNIQNEIEKVLIMFFD